MMDQQARFASNGMKKKPPTTSSKKITIEKLAEMSQREFVAIRGQMKEGFEGIRGEMVTKTEFADKLSSFQGEMREEFQTLRETVKSDFREAVQEIREEIRSMNYSAEIDGLRQRVKRLEEKIGISRR